jgi:hypothetical protein
MSEIAKRPGGVTFVGILIIIAGVGGVINGISRWFQSDRSSALVVIAIIATLVIGIIYLLVAKGIFDGNRFSRFLVTIISVINLVIGGFGVIASIISFNGVALLVSLVQALWSLLIIVLLHGGRARAFFG